MKSTRSEMRWAAAALTLALFQVQATSVLARGCTLSLPILHPGVGTANGGGFLIPERSTTTVQGCACGPRLRFWLYGQAATFNSGSQAQFDPGMPWLPNVAAMHGLAVSPELYFLEQTNWAGPGINGCPERQPTSRTVVEISYPVRSGSADHSTVYLIASVAYLDASKAFDFDQVVDGNGGTPNTVQTAAIPAPVPLGAGSANANDASYMDVTLSLPPAASYGDAGHPNLIAGYRVYYGNDAVPLSSFAADYKRVRDAASPRNTLDFIPFGTPQIKVAVPKPQSSTYFVTELVYADPTLPVSNGVSGNSQPVAALATDEPETDEEVAESVDDDPEEEASGEQRPDEDPDAAAPAETADKASGSDGTGGRDRESEASAEPAGDGSGAPTEATAQNSAGAAGSSETNVSLPGNQRSSAGRASTDGATDRSGASTPPGSTEDGTAGEPRVGDRVNPGDAVGPGAIIAAMIGQNAGSDVGSETAPGLVDPSRAGREPGNGPPPGSASDGTQQPVVRSTGSTAAVEDGNRPGSASRTDAAESGSSSSGFDQDGRPVVQPDGGHVASVASRNGDTGRSGAGLFDVTADGPAGTTPGSPLNLWTGFDVLILLSVLTLIALSLRARSAVG